jgi:protein-disulfide isomerase
MRTCLRILAVLATASVAWSAGPAIDKAKLEAYLRYAEGFMANVHFAIDEPVPSPFPNFYRIGVHLSTDAGARLDRVYYMTADGRQIVNGTIWDLNKSPFEDTLDHLPDNGYAFGPADAKVKLVIFSDFQCPYCREFARTVRENIPKNYPADVRVIFEDFPLDAIHPWARAAAEASHCVGAQSVDSFWAYHDWIFARAPEIKPDNLRDKVLAWAKEQKLDTDKLTACMDSHAQADAVKTAENAGKALQVVQTPTAFMNGRPVPGAMKWDSLDSVIKLELAGKSGGKPPVQNPAQGQTVP